MNIFQKLFFLLSSKERKSAILILLMIFFMALLDMIGVASILPFMTVLTNPDLIETNIILKFMFQIANDIGIKNNKDFLYALGFLSFLLLITSITFKSITIYLQARFVQMREHSIGKRLIAGYLHQPYSWFLNRNSADIGKTILNEVSQIIGDGIRPLMELIAKSLITIALVTLLIIVNPKLAVIAGFSLGSMYIIIFYFVRNFLVKIGKVRLENNRLRYTTINEAFGAAKEIKVKGAESAYIKNFSVSAKAFAKAHASSQIISILPRFLLEALAFGGILIIILFTMSETENLDKVLPVLSLYIFAGYRLMPALQVIYSSFAKLSFVRASLDILINDIKSLDPIKINRNYKSLAFNKRINMNNIFYNYPNTSLDALKNINLNIKANSIVGLVGATGSGKTTLVDIILGLIHPQKGTLEVDETIINSQNSRNWQCSIGYVPQNIYLSDDTIAANIAFGEESGNINQNAVERASKIANLHNFVQNHLPHGYQTVIGERGIRLSGGQRQRIGIARALYCNPKVLVLDEATSALDNQTEQLVMNAVMNYNKDITIILIAHRLSTVKECDNIFFLENGELKAQGSFEELIKINKNFRSMVELS